ncbi:Hypothetical Protein FCC1311_079642 [Hondaea fermentalgiana]|uniref:Uncharacterized protein n=1 Tax=Hondaea fermentalgiana TaxID=2315210 RepID=A0A2R5GN62_9STRA|nr:Hypothetical Protein FCC1311_079642 [Hondaea fermentalgiana]|eukprot:GBG31739.1 Hypothetical Protein FCC1311_079642 [Hondaea fermentalgiana]
MELVLMNLDCHPSDIKVETDAAHQRQKDDVLRTLLESALEDHHLHESLFADPLPCAGHEPDLPGLAAWQALVSTYEERSVSSKMELYGDFMRSLESTRRHELTPERFARCVATMKSLAGQFRNLGASVDELVMLGFMTALNARGDNRISEMPAFHCGNSLRWTQFHELARDFMDEERRARASRPEQLKAELGRSFDAERLFKYVRMKEGGHKTAGQFNSKDVLQLIRWNNQDTKTHAALSSSAAAAATHFLTVGTAMDVALLHDKSRKPLEKILRRDTDFDSEEEVRDTFGQINEIFHGNDHKSGLVNHFNNILDFEAQNGDYIAVWFGEDSERAGNQYSHVNICTLTGRWKIMTGTGNTNTITLKPMFGDSTEGRATPVDEIYIAQFKMGAECYVNGMGYGIVADTVGCTSEEWEDRAFCVPVLIDGANDPAEYHIQDISIRISTTESDDQ